MSKNTLKQGFFWNFLKATGKSIVGSWKIGRGNGKSHGKSWNSKSSKCTNPG